MNYSVWSKINIDNYISYYKTLGENMPAMELLAKRLAELETAVKDTSLPEDECNEITKEHKALKAQLTPYAIYLDERFKGFIKFPTNEEWAEIERLSVARFDGAISHLEREIMKEILPEDSIIEKAQQNLEYEMLSYSREISDSIAISITQYESDKLVKDIYLIRYSQYLQKRIQTVDNETPVDSEGNEKLKWNGKAAQLGFIIRLLVDQGYIDAPKKPNMEINYSELARRVLNGFQIESTPASLTRSLNPNSEAGQLSEEKQKQFKIPFLGLIS